MADRTGYLCEAIVKIALEEAGIEATHHGLDSHQSLVNCLDLCPHRTDCRRQNRKPVLRVEPDFVLKLSRPVFVYVTHAESSNILNFKLWRTLGEVVEQRKYVNNSYCVDLLFGSIREKQEVYAGFRIIADESCRIGSDGGFEKAVRVFDSTYKGKFVVESIAAWLADNRSSIPKMDQLIGEVRSFLERVDVSTRTRPLSLQQQSLFRQICSTSKWNEPVPTGEVGGSLRVATILGAALIESCGGATDRFLDALLSRPISIPVPAPDYRKRGDSYIKAWELHEELDGDSVLLAPEFSDALALFNTGDAFVEFAAAYRRALHSDSTWSTYLSFVGGADQCDLAVSELLKCWRKPKSLGRLLGSSFRGEGIEFSLEILASLFNLSMNRLSQALDDDLKASHGISLKKFAPHGDDPIHVLSFLNRGRVDELRFVELSARDFLAWLLENLEQRWASLTEAGGKPSQSMVASLFRYRITKTLLTRAPSPLVASVGALCDPVLRNAGYALDLNTLTPTYLNDMLGGKVLRAGVNISYVKSNSRISFLISSTSEGNDLHKQKEYAAKVVAKKMRAIVSDREVRLIARPHEIVVIILDGSWPQEAQRLLYEAGTDLILTFQTFHLMIPFLNEIVREPQSALA